MINLNLMQKREDLMQYLESPAELRWIVGQVIEEYLAGVDIKKSVLRIIQDQNWNTPAKLVEDIVEEIHFLDRVENAIYTNIQIAC